MKIWIYYFAAIAPTVLIILFVGFLIYLVYKVIKKYLESKPKDK